MSKRRNREGTFTQRPNGAWQAQFGYTDEEGVRRRLSFYGRTQVEAANKLAEARKRIKEGQPAKDATVTVASWCDTWISTTLEASDRRESTKVLMTTLLGRHVKPTRLGAMPLAKVRPSHLDAWKLELRGRTRTVKTEDGTESTVRALADSTILRTFTVLRQVLDGAVRDELLARNPALAVDPPKADSAEARVLSAAQVAAILRAAGQMDQDRAEHGGYRTHNRALFALIAATGLRKGEALALRWEDVDFDAGTIRVRGTLSRLGGRLVVSPPKTKASRRVLAPSAGVVTLLRQHRKAQLEDRMRAANVWTDTGHVFTTAMGQPLDPRSVLRAFTTAAEKAGLLGVTVHTLRHSAATAMLDGGVHLKAVSELLGHSGTQVTAQVYAHLTAPTARKAMDGLGAALGL